jgi:hypothetical protein
VLAHIQCICFCFLLSLDCGTVLLFFFTNWSHDLSYLLDMTAGPLQLKNSREVRDMQIGRQMSTTPKRAREARYSVNPSCNVIF